MSAQSRSASATSTVSSSSAGSASSSASVSSTTSRSPAMTPAAGAASPGPAADAAPPSMASADVAAAAADGEEGPASSAAQASEAEAPAATSAAPADAVTPVASRSNGATPPGSEAAPHAASPAPSAGSSPRAWQGSDASLTKDAGTPAPSSDSSARAESPSPSRARAKAQASPTRRNGKHHAVVAHSPAAASPGVRRTDVPAVPMEDSLVTKARRLPRIYGRPPTIGVFMPPIARKTPEPGSSKKAPKGKAKAKAEARPGSAPVSARGDAGGSDAAGSTTAGPPPPKRMADMTDDELADALRRRLVERRSVPRLSKRKVVPVPTVRVSHVSNLSAVSADIVVANRLGSASDAAASVRLMISVDDGLTFRTQAVAAADVFRVDGLTPGKRYHVYAVAVVPDATKPAAAAGPSNSRKTVVHFTTHNAPADPRMGPVPGQDVPGRSRAAPVAPRPRPGSLPPLNASKTSHGRAAASPARS